MVEYNCTLCSFTTKIKTHYINHLKTKKHKDNELCNKNVKNTLCTQNAPKMHPDAPLGANNKTCEFCQKRFTRTTGLKKHLEICSYKNVENAPQKTTILPQKTTILPQKTTFLPQNTTKIFQCEYCDKILSRYDNLNRHLKICKVKKEKDIEKDNEKQIEILKKENLLLKETNKSITNNTQNINTQNNGTINYLNVNFSNVQPMEKFIENFKTKFPLTEKDRKILLNTYSECDIGLFSDTFFHMMKKYLVKQIGEDILPTIPMVCTDSNLRSIKEYDKDKGWKTTQSHKCIDQMIDISNKQIFESQNTMMCLNQKQRNKIYSRMKQENSLLSMEKDKNDYELSKKSCIEIKKNTNNDQKNNIETPIQYNNNLLKEKNNQKEMDFSIINDELIEKYSAPNAPKLIT